jgi:hypothetical protein
MPQTQKHDPDFLHAALIGLQHTLATLEERIAELRGRLGGQPAARKAAGAAPESAPKKRTMSATARKRIALAQKKRWAAFHAGKTKPAAPKPPKRVLSAEGRAHIIAATKKRWAAFHKAQRTPKKVAKRAARKTPEAAAPVAAVAAAPPAE